MKISMPMKDLSSTVMDEVRDGLQHYLIGILLPSRAESQEEFNLIGSGTLVKVNNLHGILTAAHVWEVIKSADSLHFVITTRSPSRFSINREQISTNVLTDFTKREPEWGPDLAFLKISTHDYTTISSKKSFVNLSTQKNKYHERDVDPAKRLYAITGFVEEFGSKSENFERKVTTCHFEGRAFFSSMQEKYHRGDYDYFDMGANTNLPGCPYNFGGISGGGLWEIELSGTELSSLSWDGRPYFRGIAFWQSQEAKGRRVIRCHGPKSVFETAWSKWELPRGS